MKPSFNVLDPRLPQGSHELLEGRGHPPGLGRHDETWRSYMPDEDLVQAINLAINLGMPLLLTGEAGTGKTQVAYYVAGWFGLDLKDHASAEERAGVFRLDVRSTTQYSDLFYSFDRVAYLQSKEGKPKADFLDPGPLARAWQRGRASVVLIDEIDKAPRDFPNDLLHALDQREFRDRELKEPIALAPGAVPPIVIVTSNSERRLPAPFLRRCVFHHITFSEDHLRKVVEKRNEIFKLDRKICDAVIDAVMHARKRPSDKMPATAEALALLAALALMGHVKYDQLRLDRPAEELRKVPGIGLLIKDRDAFTELGKER